MEVFGTQQMFPLVQQVVLEGAPQVLELGKGIFQKSGSIFNLATGGKVVIAIGIVAGVVYLFYKIYKHIKNKNQPQIEVFRRPLTRRIKDNQLNSVSSISTFSFQKDYEKFKCPITQQLMIEPVSLRCQHHFEKSAILQHFSKNDKKCFTCKKLAQISDIRVNQFAKQMILRFRKKAIKMGRQLMQQRISADFDLEINPVNNDNT